MNVWLLYMNENRLPVLIIKYEIPFHFFLKLSVVSYFFGVRRYWSIDKFKHFIHVLLYGTICYLNSVLVKLSFQTIKYIHSFEIKQHLYEPPLLRLPIRHRCDR